MAPPTTLYRFQIELSDIDRGVYETLDFRVAQHPSETMQYLLTRVVAFSLNAQERLEFTPGGLGSPDDPCLRLMSLTGQSLLWIEIGNPSARKLHKATKAAQVVKVYTYKEASVVMQEMKENKVHRMDEIEVFSLSPGFLDELAKEIRKDNKWSIIHNDGLLTISSPIASYEGELKKHIM